MRPPPWMLLRLGLETALHHAPADEDRLSALNMTSVAEYRGFLLRVLGFEAPVEQAIVGLVGIDAPLFKGRLRSMHLRDDLLSLGLSESDLSRASKASVTIDSAAEGLGWMFVLERQTLLAGVVRRHLQRVLGDRIRGASAYLAAPGDTPGATFRAFGEALGAAARRNSPVSIVDGANDAFRTQRHWYATAPRTKDATSADESVGSVAAIA